VRAFYESHPYPAPIKDLDRHRELYRNPDRRRASSLLLWPTEKPRANREILVAGKILAMRGNRENAACRASRLAVAAVAARRGRIAARDRDPSVAPAEGLLTEAVLKHVCVLPDRRLFGVASRNSRAGSINHGRAQQGNCGQGSKILRERPRAMNFLQ
jgi:hypothetical protein